MIQDARACWCTGMTQRDGMGREMGRGFRMGNTCTPMADSCQASKHLLNRVLLFVIPWTVVNQASLSLEFSRQEYWSGLVFPSPGDLDDPGTEPRSPALQADTLPSEPPGKDSCQCMAKPIQYYKVISLQLNKFMLKKRKQLSFNKKINLKKILKANCGKKGSHLIDWYIIFSFL